MIGVAWGLLGALLIGTSDCIARVTAQRVSSAVLFLYIMGLSLLFLGARAWLQADLPSWHAWAWFASAVSGVLNLVALYFLYRALARGPVTVASPTASSFAILVIALNALTGEPWSWQQLLAGVIVFFGIVQLARHAPEAPEDHQYSSQWLRVTAALGLAAGVSVALRMFMAQEATEYIGVMQALLLNRLFAFAGVILLFIWHLSRHDSIRWPAGRLRYLVIVQALLETAALGAFLTGSQQGDRIGATIGFAAFAAITALVARVWLKELIGWRRGLWMLVVAAGVALATLV